MRDSARSPSACQKVIMDSPKSGGRSQFHSLITIQPPMAMKRAKPATATGAMRYHLKSRRMVMGRSSWISHVVIRLAQPLAQSQHRIPLPRQQRVDGHSGCRGHCLETAPFELVGDEHVALFRWELADRLLERLEQHGAGVFLLRPGTCRRQHVLQLELSR